MTAREGTWEILSFEKQCNIGFASFDIVFSGWQFPMLPSLAVNFYIIFCMFICTCIHEYVMRRWVAPLKANNETETWIISLTKVMVTLKDIEVVSFTVIMSIFYCFIKCWYNFAYNAIIIKPVSSEGVLSYTVQTVD